jgi:hypothetical protein
MSRRRWKDYGKDWPDGHRLCRQCNKLLPFSQFHRHSACLSGYNSVCKTCRKPTSKQQYNSTPIQKLLLDRCKTRSTKKKLNFNLELSDIVIPEKCPIFNVPLKRRTVYAPSVDRINPNLGYVKENIQVISLRANVLKNNATIGELELILKHMKNADTY